VSREYTTRELRQRIAARLQDAGIERANAEARILLSLALGLDDAALIAASGTAVPAAQEERLEAMIVRRIKGEPIARIAGQKEFWSRSFRLGPETLVPRPETETLVEAALALFPDRDAALNVLDLGTGSGILLAAILLERPNAKGVGLDRSEATLTVARDNLERLGAGARAQWICGDWTAARQGEETGARYDLILSNPPYIPSDEIAALEREVRAFDPRLALDGGPDGLDAYRAIIAELPQLLSDRGAAVLELGIGQEAAVTGIAHGQGLVAAGAARPDLAGIPRALILYPRARK
jgi:release factor glutamine methyltransferase